LKENELRNIISTLKREKHGKLEFFSQSFISEDGIFSDELSGEGTVFRNEELFIEEIYGVTKWEYSSSSSDKYYSTGGKLMEV
jgi:hypothetical protein